MPRSAVELTTNFDTGESNRDLTAGLKMAKQLVERYVFRFLICLYILSNS